MLQKDSATVIPLDSPSANHPTIWAVSEYYAPNFSGAAIQAQRILSRVAQAGFTVHVLTVADQSARALAGQVETIDGLYVHYLPVVGRRNWAWIATLPPIYRATRAANEFLRGWSFHRKIRATLCSQAKPGDVIQWYVVGDATWSVFRLAKRMGWRNVIQISLIGADDPSSFRASWFGISTSLKRQCFVLADRIIGLSRALVDSCLRSGIDSQRIVRIPNGVELEQFRPATDRVAARRNAGLDPTRRCIAFVGSAIHRKGIDVAILAFLQAAKEVDDVDLLVIGLSDFQDATRHDPSRQQLVKDLQTQVTHAAMERRVHWIGQVSNVADYLGAADLFFFPTRREGLPNAMAEAMASGLPVLAGRLPGITTDLVQDGIEGWLVDGHQPSDYSSKLVTMLRDRRALERMGQAARRRIENEFDLDHVVPQYIRLYEQLSK